MEIANPFHWDTVFEPTMESRHHFIITGFALHTDYMNTPAASWREPYERPSCLVEESSGGGNRDAR